MSGCFSNYNMKKEALLKNRTVGNIFSALAVAIFGFILLNIAFLFDFIFQTIIRTILGIFISVDLMNGNYPWFPPMLHALFVILIFLISLFIFRSRLKTIYKAIYLTVPLAVVFMTIGMLLYPWPVACYLVGVLFFGCVLYYFYKTKQPWIYYYTLVLIGIMMLIVALAGVEI